MSARQSADADSTYTLDDVAVVVDTCSDGDATGTVLESIAAVTDGRAEVVCVDGSGDRRAEIASEHGATVIERAPQGAAAVLAPERPVVVTTGWDGSYPVERLPEFLDAINDGADVVSGDRLYYGAEGLDGLGNELLALLGSIGAGRRVHDLTTGMRAYRRDVLRKIQWTEDTGHPAELLVRPLIRGYDVRERPIEYDGPAGESGLASVETGAAIARSVLTVAVEERLR